MATEQTSDDEYDDYSEAQGAVGGLGGLNTHRRANSSNKNQEDNSTSAIVAAAVSAAAAKVFNNNIPFPEPLALTGNVRQNVDDFIDEFEIYLIASGLENRDERVKIATFKAALGVEARKIFNNWPLQAAEKGTVMACLASLRKYMMPKRNVKLARYEFLQCKQQQPDGVNDGETVAQFINRARALVKDCNWGNLEEEMLRDVIVAGLRDTRLKKTFIDKVELTATDVINQCMSEEATQMELEKNKWLDEERHSVNKVYPKQNKVKQCAYCGKGYHRNLQECPARGSTCFYCHQRNHFEAMCRKKQEEKESHKKGKSRSGKVVHKISDSESEESCVEADSKEEVVDMVEYLYSIDQEQGGLLKADLCFGNERKSKVVKCILNTGASCNVIGLPTLLEILEAKSVELDKKQPILKGFVGSSTRALGRATLDLRHNGQQYKAIFTVVGFRQMPILSMYSCLKLNLLKVCLSVSAEHENVTIKPDTRAGGSSGALAIGAKQGSKKKDQLVDLRCFKCEKLGHYASECLQKSTMKSEKNSWSTKMKALLACKKPGSSDEWILDFGTGDHMCTALCRDESVLVGAKQVSQPNFCGRRFRVTGCG
nr:uncharacterized protein LOC115264069 [Aedes albopictus]